MISALRAGSGLFLSGLVLLASVTLFDGAGAARAQSIDLDKDHVQMTELHGPWRFHTGDDPDGKLGWATPGFDDSGWSRVTADQPWAAQGYQGYGGVGWYRLKIVAPSRQNGLALYLPSIDNSCQVFADGRLFGQVGGLPPHPRYMQQSRITFRVPDDVSASGHPILLAIRVWYDPRFVLDAGGGVYPAPRIGNPETIAIHRKLEGREVFWENSYVLLECCANCLAGLASLTLFVLRRKQREYLWFGAYALVWFAHNVLELYAAFHPTPYFTWNVILSILFALGVFCPIEFYTALVRQRRGWLYAAAILLDLLAFFASMSNSMRSNLGPGPFFALALLLCNLCVWAMIYRAWRRGSPDALLLLVAEGVRFAIDLPLSLLLLPYSWGIPWAVTLVGYLVRGIRWPFPIFPPSFAGDLANIMILAILLRRYARNMQGEERLEAELEAARTVQQVLVPEAVPSIAGFHIESVYKPAGQVGGDFFQTIPFPEGGLLAVIGDVSGKGMPAALTVSLLVGTVRTLAHYTQSPGEILSAMNQRMLARTNGGFTTCLVLRIDTDGILTAANAGHLAPYCNGAELEIESSLPLGLSADSRYPEARFTLGASDQLTLLTDGVVEARSKDGELFGFSRTQSISCQRAEQIATAAQAFGQDDDITVLTLSLAHAEASHE